MFKIILCPIKCCWPSVMKYCRFKPSTVWDNRRVCCVRACILYPGFYMKTFETVAGKRGHSQSFAWCMDEWGISFGLEEKKKSVKRFFALLPVVVWEVASETLSALLMLLHLFREYLYHELRLCKNVDFATTEQFKNSAINLSANGQNRPG